MCIRDSLITPFAQIITAIEFCLETSLVFKIPLHTQSSLSKLALFRFFFFFFYCFLILASTEEKSNLIYNIISMCRLRLEIYIDPISKIYTLGLVFRYNESKD